MALTNSSRLKLDPREIALIAIPFCVMLWVWLSSLSFVPVPWPDDSAFYFVAKEFFKWPPRWVMLPQAPFEPTYRIYNFNTMPLYPLLIGIIRFFGIDGSFGIKILPLTAWAASASLLGYALYRNRLPFALALLSSSLMMFDPIPRWASVIVRPESLIGLCGVAIVLGLTLGFPKRFQERGFWHPLSFLLAVGAYAHFNAVHLLWPVLLVLITRPREMIRVGCFTLLYLTPWIITVALKPALFVHQMTLQWSRLAIPNGWLETPAKAVDALFNDMGSPETWPALVHPAMWVFSMLVIVAIFWGLLSGLKNVADHRRESSAHSAPPSPTAPSRHPLSPASFSLAPAGAWVLGAVWLWHSKPEVWFTTYTHLALWTFCGLALLKLHRAKLGTQVRSTKTSAKGAVQDPEGKSTSQGSAYTVYARVSQYALLLPMLFCLGSFAAADLVQERSLSKSHSWNWPTYHSFIDCIDQELTRYETALGNPTPFRVWAPTFPDITIELSRRHPAWELTRTNDFSQRADLAVQHGHDVEAVVVPETLRWKEDTISAPAAAYPEKTSVWMTWDGYFLNRLWKEAGWKPNRYICQRGRWEAYLFMNPVISRTK
ncbi:MAG: hypothetical protein H7222_10265 [Methylotenera sp.]|nr:hypothetical protein [Oligoflexia bacterium]